MRYVAVSDILISILCVKVKWVQECVCLGVSTCFLIRVRVCVRVCLWACLWEPNTPRHVEIRFQPVDSAIAFWPQWARLVPPSGPRHLLSPTVHKKTHKKLKVYTRTPQNAINLFQNSYWGFITLCLRTPLTHDQMTLMHSLSGILF